MRRLLSFAVVGALLTGAAGCATNELETRREVTQAALAAYPGGARTSETYKLAAVDNPGRRTVEVVNLTDTAVPEAKVWVNGRYVKQIPGVPARGTVAIPYADLLESGGGVLDLARAEKSQVSKVELQTGGGLYTVDGPARR